MSCLGRLSSYIVEEGLKFYSASMNIANGEYGFVRERNRGGYPVGVGYSDLVSVWVGHRGHECHPSEENIERPVPLPLGGDYSVRAQHQLYPMLGVVGAGSKENGALATSNASGAPAAALGAHDPGRASRKVTEISFILGLIQWERGTVAP